MNGITFPYAEHAFQAAKCANEKVTGGETLISEEPFLPLRLYW